MKVRQQLQDKGLVPDDWGGDTIFVECSALTKQGIDKLLEMILLQADLLELKANPNRHAKGNVIESGVEPGGPTATVLVRKGTLARRRHYYCAANFTARVRALINEEGQRLKEAGPSVAVRVLGLNGVPEAGLEFSVVEDEKAARELAEQRFLEARAAGQEDKKVTLENLFATLAAQSGQGAQSRRQGGHARLGRGHCRGAQENRGGKSFARSHPQRRRHDHGKRRGAGVRVERDHSRFSHARSTAPPPKRPSAPACRSNFTRSFTN